MTTGRPDVCVMQTFGPVSSISGKRLHLLTKCFLTWSCDTIKRDLGLTCGCVSQCDHQPVPFGPLGVCVLFQFCFNLDTAVSSKVKLSVTFLNISNIYIISILL